MRGQIPEFELRRGADDWALYRQVRLAALRESPRWFGSSVEREERFGEDDWRRRAERAVVAVIDSEPVGVVSWVWVDEPAQADLVAMWVAPDVRGRGVAAALVRSVVDEVVTRRHARLTLGVVADNHGAISLYRREGFVDDGEEIGSFSGDLLVRMRYDPPRPPAG